MRFSGIIGFTETVEDGLDIYKEQITERPYRGDVIRNIGRNVDTTDKINADFNINNEFSVVSDSYLRENFMRMRYICWRGVKWKITSADASTFPRIIINVGGVYNDPAPSAQ